MQLFNTTLNYANSLFKPFFGILTWNNYFLPKFKLGEFSPDSLELVPLEHEPVQDQQSLLLVLFIPEYIM